MKNKTKSVKTKNILHRFSYNAYIDSLSLDSIKILIFNHGTQSNIGTRTKSHVKDCKTCEYPFNYHIISEPEDRVINGKIIRPCFDKDFVLKVGALLDEDCCLLRDADRLIYKECLGMNLSETECVVIHYTNKADCITKLMAAIETIENTWYYINEDLRTNIPDYNPDRFHTDMSVRPFTRNSIVRNFVEDKIDMNKTYNLALVQGLVLADFIHIKFNNIKHLIVFTSEYHLVHS